MAHPAHHLLDAVDHKLGFGLVGGGLVDLQPVGVDQTGPQVERPAFGALGDDLSGGIQDNLGGAVVAAEVQGYGVRIVAGELQVILAFRSRNP